MGPAPEIPAPVAGPYVLHHPKSDRFKEGWGSEHDTTNNRMEMLAVIKGLEALKKPSTVELFSDSDYVVKGINERMAVHHACRWHKSANSRQLIKNADLWQRVWELAQTHRLTAHWIEGHAGHPENERCNTMAETAAAQIKTPVRRGPKTLEDMADDLLREADRAEEGG